MGKYRSFRADLLLIAVFIGAGALLALFLFFSGKTGKTVQVRVDGSVVKTFSLEEDTVYTIEGVNKGSNLLIIRDGYAWIEEASCPDSLCIHMGKISKTGQSLVCLPNKVVVEICGDADSPQKQDVDVITGQNSPASNL